MTITNINIGQAMVKAPVNPIQEMPKEQDVQDIHPKEEKGGKLHSAEMEKISPEELVMKPNPISVEERLNQVISIEDIKSLLAVKGNAIRTGTKDKHLIDVKR